MRIRHSRLTKDFLQVPNATVRDDRLSHMARGILVELLSRPDGWQATADDMWRASVARHGKESPGRRMFRAAFAELKKHGYLTATREPMKNGQLATALTLTDVSAGQTDVPQAGTSARPATTDVSAGGTDVPHAGTSEGLADVPHGGTSNTEYGKTNTEEKTSSSADAPARSITADEKLEFGRFWALYPKSKDYDKTLTEWTAAVLSGADPQKITAAAVAYAKEKAGEEFRFIAHSHNWLKRRSYLDTYAPEPNGQPNLRSVPGDHQPWRNPVDQDEYDEPFWPAANNR
ncbi:hypothetical protein AB0F24_17625 [Streptomyces platensis]|uniref:hypothetical protein n=1 Tax=Streptomyces platensis TaxID=58346 RepID=UPI0033D8C6BD